MSGNKKGEDDWKCDNCSNVNFSWRVQCNRCRQLKSENGGIDGGKIALGIAGAAIVGFLGKKLWDSFQTEPAIPKKPASPPPNRYWTAPARQNKPQSSNQYWTAPRQNQPQPSTSTSSTFRKTDGDTEEKKKAQVPTEYACVVCMINQKIVCLLPCYHLCLCAECSNSIESICPMCKGKIEGRKHIYL